MPQDQQPFVVVGGGLAGGKAVEQLREAGYDGPLVLVSAEPHLPYERPPLSKDFLMGKAERDVVFVHPRAWYVEQDVELVLGEEVTALDVGAHTIGTSSGRRMSYAKLLLAPGAQPRTLDLPDLDDAHAQRVLSLRTLDDSERLRGWLRPGTRLVVVGGGWIGLEAAAAARQAGADVTVLEMDPVPLQRVLGAQVATAFADKHRAQGVHLRCEVSVSGIVEDGDGLRVRLEGGDDVPADVVLVGIGVSPRVALAQAAGLEVDNGIVTDAQLRTSDPDVFACGDAANVLYTALGRRVRVEHWATALNQPATAARAMLGGDETYDLLPYFFTDQYDLGMEYHGLADPTSQQLLVRGDLGGGEFVAVWLDDDGVVSAAMHVNQWDDGDAVKALVGTHLDAARFTDRSAPLG
ncbi:NAD(P)/FAD-dependent oxidoreductase [Angustibacter luteus]|uniref:NAD(P)/FAD-dependent oxidoreductase n=1 Tax=Angustibacter luteus TaxID=658456 RepID=A0ABW1JJH1_9ACTN